MDEENEFYDSDYNFNGKIDKEDGDNSVRLRTEVEIEGEPRGVGSDDDVESDYARPEELQSFS